MSEVLRQYYAAVNDRNYEKIKELVSPDFAYHQRDEPDKLGYDVAIGKFLKQFLDAYPTTMFEITKIEEDGEFILVWAKMDGDYDCKDKFRLENGIIVEQWTGENQA